MERLKKVIHELQVSIQQTDFLIDIFTTKKTKTGYNVFTKSLYTIVYSHLAGFALFIDSVVHRFTFTHSVVIWGTCAQQGKILN